MSGIIEKRQHFIRQIVEEDLRTRQYNQITTRFPPEPNGYLHIGHAKSICLNFEIAQEYNGKCYLRMDDTNPVKEEEEYANAIKEDVQWLGFTWAGQVTHASDYYNALYEFALTLIKQGDAYVDSLSMEQIRDFRGTLQKGGQDSPYRHRPITENLELFIEMKNGKFSEGSHVLRAKIDMQSGNLNMRDPIMYRIRYASHQRTGALWCIYPMYDYAHPLSDALENITHSLCTLEFQDHRPLYEWFINKLNLLPKPCQIEFARLNVSHTITSKRKLRQLVEEGYVSGWDDPRMPTLKGMRQRGYPPLALRQFCEVVGVTKSDSNIDMGVLEECVRDELNQHAPRAMCVLRPLKVVIENFSVPFQELYAANHPQHPELGQRALLFTREIYIEQDDFMEEPPKGFHRLSVGNEVRLRNAYVIKCNGIIKDPVSGKAIELRCTYDPNTLGKNPERRKIKGVIHWAPVSYGLSAEVRLYDRLFIDPNPAAREDFTQCLNPKSLEILVNCIVEPALAKAAVGLAFQFERLGYFIIAKKEPEKLVINQIVGLRDTWNIK